MTTKITLAIANPEQVGSSWQLELADDFDTVFSKVAPLTAPGSTLEHRANMVHTLTDGRRVSIQPHLIAAIEEGEEDS